jgi:hypothetical protein
MGWARFDDNYTDNPKIRDAGPWAELLDMRAIIYCARYDTDGRLTTAALQLIRHGIPKVGDKVGRLITVGRWTIDPNGGWQVKDFLEHNLAKVERDRVRAMGRERQASYRARRNGVTNAYDNRGGGSLGGGGAGGGGIRERTRCATCDRLDVDCGCDP